MLIYTLFVLLSLKECSFTYVVKETAKTVVLYVWKELHAYVMLTFACYMCSYVQYAHSFVSYVHMHVCSYVHMCVLQIYTCSYNSTHIVKRREYDRQMKTTEARFTKCIMIMK